MIFIMTFSALIFAAQNAALLLQKSRAFPEGLIAKRKKISMLTISTIKENCFASSYSKGRELFLEKKYKDVEISGGQDEDGEPFQMIQGQVKGHSSHWYTTEVYMDEDDDIKDYYCTCPPTPLTMGCANIAWLWPWNTGIWRGRIRVLCIR